MLFEATRPSLPLSPSSYVEYRRQLWAHRGPNVQTKGDSALLPCYQHALTKLGVAKEEDSIAAAAASPNTPPNSVSVVTPSPTSAAAADPWRVLEVMRRGVRAGAAEPFYAIDLHAALAKLALWRALLPNVEPFYAVKCNGDPALLLTLANAGVGFDCASAAEIDAVLGLGVSASRLLYANPIKQPTHVKRARDVGVNLTVFDAAHELGKMSELHPSCGLLLRIAVDDSQAQCVLSNKYGAQPKDAEKLLEAAYEKDLNVVGVSFHVGSGSSSTDAFRDAVERAARVFDLAEAKGKPMTILDVGGGFPGVDTQEMSFASMAKGLSAALDEHFPRDKGAKRGGVRLIAEPGRFFACSTHHLAVNIIGKKVVPSASKPSEETAPPVEVSDNGNGENGHGAKAESAASSSSAPRTMYYINDGLYGSFNCVLYDHATPECEVLLAGGENESNGEDGMAKAASSSLPCSVWGPTCDGIDCVLADATLPPLETGDWLVFRDMGAYTSCAGSNFNGMALPDVVYLQAAPEGAEGGQAPQPPHVATERMLRQMGWGGR